MPDDFDDRPRRRRDDDEDFDAPRRRRDRDRDEDDFDRPPPRKSGSKTLLIVLGVVGVLFLACGGAAVYGVFSMRESANRMKSSNNLKQMALGVHNYHDTHSELPSNSFTADDKPLLSWRVHLLPYIEQDRLYMQFKLDEPWDGPTNKLLLDRMPAIYARPGAPASTRLTHYRGFSSPGTVFNHKLIPGINRGFNDRFGLGKISDGLSNTAMIVEAADPIEWTKPDDLDGSPGKPFPAMGGDWSGKNFNVGLADGSVRPFRRDTPEPTLRALVTYAGND